MRWLFSSPASVDHDRILAALRAAERSTSGKIRVVLARHRTRDPLGSAQRHFSRLGMAAEPEHNGVLIFVAARSRAFAIVGDRGIHEKCGDSFWRELTAAMETYFKRGDFTGGLVHGIERAGELLAEHFPAGGERSGPEPGDVQEVD
jgi:uncharacterized membrane protein